MQAELADLAGYLDRSSAVPKWYSVLVRYAERGIIRHISELEFSPLKTLLISVCRPLRKMALLLHLLTLCQPGMRESKMPKAILNCGPDSIYDDDLPFRYHFLDKHRTEFIKCIGHSVIFYEPRHTGGRKAYTATAKVVNYYADNDKGPGHFYGVLQDFRYFDEIVPHRVEGRYLESTGLTSRGKLAC